MLEEFIGCFLKEKDIPSNGTIRKLLYGMNPLYVIDTLYRINIASLQHKSINPEMEIPWKTMDEALSNFSVFNLFEDVENAAKTSKVIHKPIVNVDDYVDRVSNKYFIYRRQQLDCSFVINGVKGELLTLANRLNIKIDGLFSHTLRMTGNQRLFVGNEIEALKMVKRRLKELCKDLSDVVWALYVLIPRQNAETFDLDL